MICVINYTSGIWILILHLKNALHVALNFIFYPHDFLRPSPQDNDCNFSDLPSAKFRDVVAKIPSNSDVDNCCSICLNDFDGEDEVSKLTRCGHVFHGGCIHGWIEGDRFTCPLCRSLLFVDLHRNRC